MPLSLNDAQHCGIQYNDSLILKDVTSLLLTFNVVMLSFLKLFVVRLSVIISNVMASTGENLKVVWDELSTLS